MHFLGLIVILIVRNSESSGDRLIHKMKPVSTLYEMEIAGDDFVRSFHYLMQKETVRCIRVLGDGSIFHERLVAGIQPYFPLAVISDSRNSTNICSITLLTAANAIGLWNIIKAQPFGSRDRLYCLVNDGKLDAVRTIFKKHTNIFRRADVAIFTASDYRMGLEITSPNRELEEIVVPLEGHWKVQEANSSKTVIRFTTGNCNFHGIVTTQYDGRRNVYHYSFGGTDWEIFSEIAKIMNWTTKYVHTTSEQELGRYGNDTWQHGMLGSLVDNKADVAFCGIWIDRTKRGNGIQMSVPMTTVCIQYLVPRPVISPTNLSVAKCFTPMVYIVTFLTLITTCFTLNAINRADKYFVPNTDKSYRSWQHCFLVLWGMIVDGTQPSQSPDLGSARRIILLWAILSMLISCSYSSKLIANFTYPEYTRKPSNLRELVEFGYRQPMYGMDMFPWRNAFDLDDPYVKQWLNTDRLVGGIRSRDVADQLRNTPNMALFGTMYESSIFIPGSKHKFRIPADVLAKYETMDQCLSTFYEAFAVRQGSPFYQPINKYLTLFTQFGILEKIYSDAVEEIAKSQPALRNLTVRETHELEPLAFGQLSVVFYAHQVGSAFSLLVFITEILVHRKRSGKNILARKVIITFMVILIMIPIIVIALFIMFYGYLLSRYVQYLTDFINKHVKP